ncbi:hypothetical protein ANN_12390 [Periplaneta americana]|uniref:Uncharacterized protein n=1 Tax=Periplaneta americana TaxID=6978 RepID=A0ABQ8TGN0_PERAM|nr:hypothetical protein ANN_12390 [Periplaneta americana]
MAGLCEGGNEPPGSLKPRIQCCFSILYSAEESCISYEATVEQKAESMNLHLTHFDIGRHTRIPTRAASFRTTGSTLKKKSPLRTRSACTPANVETDIYLTYVCNNFHKRLGKTREFYLKQYVFPNSSHSCHYRRYRTYRYVLFRMNALLARQLLCLLGYTPLRKCRKIEFSRLIG